MAVASAPPSVEEVVERARSDTPWYAKNLLKIVNKEKQMVALDARPAQLALDGMLEAQREAGKPQRAIVLKARQIGISTWVQGKLIQQSTLVDHNNALVVAHDVETGGKLFAMGQRMYSALPNDVPELKPPIRAHKRTRFMHFGQRGEAWMEGTILPDSTYWVDTAGEFESGRGGTYHQVHMSEFAFWPQALTKQIALNQGVPESPDTLIVIESTANGNNHFKDLWDDAVDGNSEYVAFFWPWWKEDEYRAEFANEAEREEFRVGDTDQSPYAEEEVELTEPGPIDTLTGKHVPLTKEQLLWRRRAIGNRTGGKIDKFHQEYPATPEQAFLATGRKVFEPQLVAKAWQLVMKTDPPYGRGGPIQGRVEAGSRPLRAGRLGKVEVPIEPKFKPARLLLPGEDSDWRFWLPEENGAPVIPEDGRYVIGNDVSGGFSESDGHEGDPAYHAIQVIDHRTLEQVCEYRSRVDPAVLTEHVYLTALLFNNAWLAPEITGGFGGPIANTIWLDFHYQFMYFRRTQGQRTEKQRDNLGFDTRPNTKPELLSLGAELLRTESHGIKSRRLISEMTTYIRLSTGKTLPEKGKFADLLMSWLIAQFVARQLPVREPRKKQIAVGFQPRNSVTGY